MPKWKKGQTGNPNGRPKDPNKKEVLEIFKAASPELLEIGIQRAKGYTTTDAEGNEVFVPGDNGLLKEFIKKMLPDNINLGVEDQTIKDFMAAILAHRPPGAVGD